PPRGAPALRAARLDAGRGRGCPVARRRAPRRRARGHAAGGHARDRPRAPAGQRGRDRGGADAVPDADAGLLVPGRLPVRTGHERRLMAPITYDHVTKRFGETAAVDDLSIEIADGEFLVLVGPSGCGKSTALRLLAGLDDLTDGRIL